MLSVVTGMPDVIGDEMITNQHADLITFTGSVPVGKHIALRAGYRRTVLELGGNDPLIVMEDADLEKAAELAVAGATKNSGQRCTAVKRILVVESIADALVPLLVEKAKVLVCGDPTDPATDASARSSASRPPGCSSGGSRTPLPTARNASTVRRDVAHCFRRQWSIGFPPTASWCAKRPSVP